MKVRTVAPLLLLALGTPSCGDDSPGGENRGGTANGGSAGMGKGGAAVRGGAPNGGSAGKGAGGAPIQGGSANGGAADGGTASGGIANGGSGGQDPMQGGASGGLPQEKGGTGGIPDVERGGSAGAAGMGGDDAGASGQTNVEAGAGGRSNVEAGAGGQANGTGGQTNGTGGQAGGEAGAGGESNASESLQWLGPCTPYELSSDGKTVLAREGLWTEATGWIALPGASLLSGDGRTVHGYADGQRYRWTAEAGFETLPGLTDFFAFGTNADGSVLVGCTLEERFGRWTPETGLSVVDLTWTPGWPAEPWCQGGGYASSDASTFVFDTGNALDVARYTATGELVQVSNQTLRMDYYPTAISGNGLRVAGYRNGSISGTTFDCLYSDHGPNDSETCALGSNQYITDFNYDASVGIGVEYPGSSGGRCPLGTGYWSSAGPRFLSDGLFELGNRVDALRIGPGELSADGRTVLGIGTRHFADGSTATECFLAAPADPSAADDAVYLAAKTDSRALNLSASGSCAIRSDGTLACWGADVLGLVGSNVGASWSAFTVPGLSNVRQVSTSLDHACAVVADGRIYCWGKNGSGQLGTGSNVASATPVEVVGIDNAVQVSVRQSSTCAVLDDGGVRCWGENQQGQLGDGTMNDSAIPQVVPAVDHAIQIAHLGGYLGATTLSSIDELPIAACALRDDGSLWCWGGDLDWDSEPPKEPYQALTGIRGIAPSVGWQLCLSYVDGRFGCQSEVPLNFTLECVDQPNDGAWFEWDFLKGRTLDQGVGGLLSVPANTVQLAAGRAALCALLADGTIQCKGNNMTGVLGRGLRHRAGRPEYAPVVGIQGAVEIAMGDQHVCAVLSDGQVQCWGLDDAGQLGNGQVYSNFPRGLARPDRVRDGSQ